MKDSIGSGADSQLSLTQTFRLKVCNGSNVRQQCSNSCLWRVAAFWKFNSYDLAYPIAVIHDGQGRVITASRKQSLHPSIYRRCLPSMATSYADAAFGSSKFSSPGRPKPSA
jgi:hypothetical protein